MRDERRRALGEGQRVIERTLRGFVLSRKRRVVPLETQGGDTPCVPRVAGVLAARDRAADCVRLRGLAREHVGIIRRRNLASCTACFEE